MRVPGSVLALFAAICIFCTACGCLGPSPPPDDGGEGITPVNEAEPQGPRTLTGALADLDLLLAEGRLNLTNTTLHQVIGTGVDLDGRAASWALGLRDGGEVRWLTFGISGWQEVKLAAPLPEDEILFDEILLPEDLLAERGGVLAPALERAGADTVDIALAREVYTVTVRSDTGMERFSFRADTGEVIG
ncbi:MAG TPA: hypothetical protein PKV78_00925 [Methanoculleus thermophilus]|nr:hypothetical protein [Methanoculleus thermophilus]